MYLKKMLDACCHKVKGDVIYICNEMKLLFHLDKLEIKLTSEGSGQISIIVPGTVGVHCAGSITDVH